MLDIRPTLLIGLGNPGEEYAGTYHNAGWEALDFFEEKLQKRYGSAPVEHAKSFDFKKYGTHILVYPNTFMNLSGAAVAEALKRFKKNPEESAVFHDDSDLALGEYRLGTGSAAGHHGVESIFANLVLKSAPPLRIRIGIRDPREKTGERPRRKAGDFVLKRIASSDKEKLKKVFAALAEEILG